MGENSQAFATAIDDSWQSFPFPILPSVNPDEESSQPALFSQASMPNDTRDETMVLGSHWPQDRSILIPNAANQIVEEGTSPQNPPSRRCRSTKNSSRSSPYPRTKRNATRLPKKKIRKAFINFRSGHPVAPRNSKFSKDIFMQPFRTSSSILYPPNSLRLSGATNVQLKTDDDTQGWTGVKSGPNVTSVSAWAVGSCPGSGGWCGQRTSKVWEMPCKDNNRMIQRLASTCDSCELEGYRPAAVCSSKSNQAPKLKASLNNGDVRYRHNNWSQRFRLVTAVTKSQGPKHYVYTACDVCLNESESEVLERQAAERENMRAVKADTGSLGDQLPNPDMCPLDIPGGFDNSADCLSENWNLAYPWAFDLNPLGNDLPEPNNSLLTVEEGLTRQTPHQEGSTNNLSRPEGATNTTAGSHRAR